MIDKVLKLLVYSALILQVKAQFGPLLGPLAQFGNLPILSQLFSTICNSQNRVNEVYSACGNNACQNTCRNPTAATGCSGACVAGCVCATGYVRNSANVCVLPQNCDVSPSCPLNEVYNFCGDSGCPQTCTSQNTACNPICSTPKCICLTGYVRNANGQCVLPSQCPQATVTCVRANEELSPCGNDGCQRTCTNLDVTTCVRVCSVPGCICAFGYVRNTAGECVLPTACPPISTTCTGVNEVYSPCGNDGCQRSCTNLNVNNCLPTCGAPGCICAPGFVRNTVGICSSPLACPITSCSASNEVFTLCGNDGCQRSCTRLDVTNCVPSCSLPGCICAAGFVRSSNLACVLASTCPVITCTRPNEVYSPCGNDGCQQSCTRFDVSTCVRSCTTPGCVCNVGFVRDAAQNCILPSACPIPTCTGLNEISSTCGNDGCQRSCTRLDVTGCTPACSAPACICAPGFVRNTANACVQPATCPPVVCTGINEIFSPCGNDGCQRTCTRLDTSGCTRVCTVSGCVCAAGFVRNIGGICVLPTSCPSVTCNGANEIFSPCGEDGCRRTCTRLDATGCAPVCSVSSCICAPGFVRNGNGLCVNPTTCPSVTCTGTNEIFSTCGDDGCQLSCSRLDATGCNRVCTMSGCICAPGFVRNAARQCVAASACPPVTCPAGEVFSACGNDGCQPTCTRLETTGCTRVCTGSACVCSAGLVRNSVGVCVPPGNCPLEACPGTNEVFSACANNGCQRSCSRLDVTGCTSVCMGSGCICIAGYVRNIAGACVLPTACPVVPCTRANEVFSPCGDDGCQRTCSRLDVSGCTGVCSASGCICAPGYVRSPLGTCIIPTSCTNPTTCTVANEVFSACGEDGCQKTCTRLDVTGCNPVCMASGCVCVAGFVRNSQGACVAQNTCPSVTCPGTNEVFSPCGEDGCQRTCSRLDVSGCSRVCTASACVCVSGYVRNGQGVCVLPETCPSITCTGTNEVISGCGNDGCQRTCLRQEVTGCSPVCGGVACICSPGFVRNSLGLCVLPTTCPSVTCSGANEVFSACGNDGCQRSCLRLDVTGCTRKCTVSGCICASGYVRNTMGVCVMPTACPPVTCGSNEIFSQCGDDGCQRSCDRLVVTGCTRKCTASGCVCNVGYVKNNVGACVLPTTCPAVTCNGVNEVYSACGDDGCQRTCARLVTTGCNKVCTNPSCVCAPLFVRNAAGQCVNANLCPSTTCLTNEEYSDCADNGCQLSCRRQAIDGCVPVCKASGCRCITGFVRNDAGECVMPSACPVVTCPAPMEVFSPCGDDGCRPSCARRVTSGCNSKCTLSGCICQTPAIRNAMGVCVLPASCPNIQCSGANEEYSDCADNGCRRTCLRRNSNMGCDPVCKASGCICSSGFIRDVSGACVASCPNVPCPDGETFSACGQSSCVSTCDYTRPVGCPVGVVCADSGCICSGATLRNSFGQCVTMANCPMTCTGTNQILTACANCQPTCANQYIPPTCVCDNLLTCACRSGYIRTGSPIICVLPQNCP